MKLATLRDGSRDGQLAVVSRDHTTAHFASEVAGRLQAVLDDWNFLSPQLEDLYAALNAGKARHAFPFDSRQCLAPLPRAHCWAVVDNTGAPEHGPGGQFLGPCDAAPGGACSLLLVAVTGDLPAGAGEAQSLDAIRLLTVAAAWGSPADPSAAWPATIAFAPLAVTPDELGAGWRGGRVALPVRLTRAGHVTMAAADRETGAPSLAAAVCRLAVGHSLGPGSLIGVDAGARLEPAAAGDRLRIEVLEAGGGSVFGAIDPQVVERAPGTGG